MTYDEYQEAMRVAVETLNRAKTIANSAYQAERSRVEAAYRQSPDNDYNRSLVEAWVTRKGNGAGTRYFLKAGHPIADIASSAGNAGAWATTEQLRNIFGPHLLAIRRGRSLKDADPVDYVTQIVR